MRRVFVGTAGWSIPSASAHHCAGDGSHLQRYARVFACAEINSSFHRPHAPAVYERWARSVGASFRFAVKLPRVVTHDLKLRRAREPLEQFLAQSAGLGRKRGPLLVQLPPSLAFESRVARTFFDLLRARTDGLVVCEPRHPTWFSPAAEALLLRFAIGRVAADPPPAPGAAVPGGWPGIVYYRLHGAPHMYWSKYDDAYIRMLSDTLRAVPASVPAWCIFDNTASGAALENAWQLQNALTASPAFRTALMR
jgi:uncharacterized protein YecE (DUF72 family)